MKANEGEETHREVEEELARFCNTVIDYSTVLDVLSTITTTIHNRDIRSSSQIIIYKCLEYHGYIKLDFYVD